MAVTSLSLVTTIPALVSIVIAAVIIYVLIQCVCSKSGASADPELTSAQSKRATVLLPDQHQQQQPAISDTNGVHLEVETGVTPLSASLNSHNGTAHSRGNSADLTRIDRHSGASTGSSPRPNAISRLLPDIPIAKTDTLPHPHSQDTKSSTSTLESQNHSRGGHSHSTLPDIPLNQTSALESSVVRRDNPIHTSPLGFRSAVSSPEKNSSIGKMAGKNVSAEIDDQDDYDHIVDNKSKKPRPKSDYDHVKIVGDKTMIVPSKNKLKENDNDYAEVEKDNIYEITEDVTVVPISQPQTSTKPLKKVKSIEDPYNRIKGDDPPYNKIFDPYNKVSDVYDPYDDFKDTESTGTRSSVRNKTKSPMSFRDVTDPYATLGDDERNVSNQTDPYSRVGDTESEIDDPYNKVIEESDTAIPNAGSPIPDYNDNDYATVSKVNDVEYAKVNKPSIRDRHRNSGAVNDLDTGNGNHSNAGASGSIPPPPSAARTEIIQDEYATVVKIRNFSSSGNGAPQPNGASASSAIPSANGTDQEMVRSGNSDGLSADINTPPEPPRGYALDTGQDTDHYNTVSVDRPGTGAQTSGGGDTSQGSSGKKKEPPYNKLSVRESLASMNARISSNTYEYVSEVDNLYATVEGGSGDGIIRPKSTATETPGRDRESVVSEHYAQIEGASAAPAPPSLDSLHETAKHHLVDVRRKDARPGDLDYYNIPDNNQGQSGVRGHQRTPSGHQIQVQGHNRTLSGQGHSQSQGHFRTPSGDVMTSSFEGRVTLATEEVVDDLDIDPNYQSVQEGQISDLNSEFDPNYETVEEAKSKAKYEEINGARTKDQKLIRNHIYEEADAKSKYEVVNGANKSEDVKIRAHVYEEVTITNEARRTRQRVLNQHTYEEVPNVKDDNQGQSSNQGEGHDKHSGAQGQSVGGVEKRKKGHERTSSSDFRFGKRKSAEVKDKKDKRKSDGKENRKSGEGGKK